MFRITLIIYHIKIIFVIIILNSFCKADWVEIPQLKPFTKTSKTTGPTFYSETKTPVNIVFQTDQIKNLESFNSSKNNWQTKIDEKTIAKPVTSNTTIDKFINITNKILTKPAKSYILEVFSSTTQFTPLMNTLSVVLKSVSTESSIPISTTTYNLTELSTTTKRSSIFRPTESSVKVASTAYPAIRRKSNNKRKTNVTVTNNFSDGIEIEDADNDDDADFKKSVNKENTFSKSKNGDKVSKEDKAIPEDNGFSTFAGFLPFLKSIQKTLLEKAHNSIKNKVQILIDLRDHILYDIDQRIKHLWTQSEDIKSAASSARGYKEDYHHMEFPSNEAALMTIGFLTLAAFLVKLVLKVIYVLKYKYYSTTTTTTTTAAPGRRRRSIGPDIDTTHKILTYIEDYQYKFDYEN